MPKSAKLIWSGKMAVNSLVDKIRILSLRSPQAVKLQEVVMTMLMEGGDFKIHNNEVNLSWLSKFIGVTRQSFYPGRGSTELRTIVNIINENITEISPYSSHRPAHENIKVSVALHKALAENEQLRRELLKLRKRWTDLYGESMMVVS
jgi:predicted glycoside hydrolase/deacetylase ChbG (UPF0249 family)